MPYVLQSDGEELDHSFDWSPFLEEGGSPSDSVISATWSITPLNDGSPTEPVITSTNILNGNATLAFVKGLQHRKIYRLICRAVTAQGRTSQQSVTIRGGPR